MKVHSLSGKIVLFLGKYSAYIFLKILNLTIRYSIKGDPKPYPVCIYIAWHQNILTMLMNRHSENIATLISPSFDGELIAQTASLFGFLPVRGSSSKQGTAALKELLDTLKSNNISMTPDGPKGPRFIMKDSPFFLSYFSKKPVVPIKVTVNSKWVFNSWDQFILPKPFCRIEIEYLPPVFVLNKEDIARESLRIQTLMTPK